MADFDVSPPQKPRLELVPADHALKEDVVEAQVIETEDKVAPGKPIGTEGEKKLDDHWKATRKKRACDMPTVSTIARTEGLSYKLDELTPAEAKTLWRAISAYEKP